MTICSIKQFDIEPHICYKAMEYRRYQRYSDKPNNTTKDGRGKEAKGDNGATDTIEIRIP